MTNTDTITLEELQAKMEAAGLDTRPWGEEIKFADQLAKGDLFLVTAPDGSGDAVMFEVKRIIPVGKFDIKEGEVGVAGTYGSGGEQLPAGFKANSYDSFTVLVPPAN